ncbi:ComEC/Rec2 family competence protein [Aureitalea marina]|uniref:ComEC/Rec2-related protein domain-containing protein n=1 Tax=Aureitalea marina TaxID=930804 RepID=A0A2S7KLU2_9FLAO|nr:ComEC/Rec2 family competence protein [Aureitalea marina]PQB03561.1 hypothetical protein BST85_00600 [Aureitalea marina]
MKPANRYVIFRLALAFATGIALAWLVPSSTKVLETGILPTVIVLIIGFFRLRKTGFEWAANLIFLILGGLSLQASLLENGHYPLSTAICSDKDQLIKLEITAVRKPNSFYQVYVANVTRMDSSHVHGRVLLRTALTDSLQLIPGDQMLVYANMDQLDAPSNPGQWDMRSYWNIKQVFHQIKLNASQILTKYPREPNWNSRIYRFRKKLISDLKSSGLEEDQLGVTIAMLLGDRSGVDTELRQNFQKAGAMHLLAISGLHVGLIFLILKWISHPLGRIRGTRFVQILFILTGICGFACISGLSPSVVRASLLMIVYTLTQFYNRPVDSTQLLSMILLGLLIYRPLYLFDLGFQLSFLSVLSILWLAPPLINSVKTPWKMIKWIRGMVAVSIAAQLGVLPLSLYYFHQFSSVFWISSLLVIPAIGVVLVAGIVITVLAFYQHDIPWLIQGYNTFLGELLRLMEAVGTWGPWFEDVHFPLEYSLASAGIISALVFWIHSKNGIFRKLFFLSVLGTISLIAWKDLKNSKETFYVLHQWGETLVAEQQGDQLIWMHSDSLTTAEDNYAIRDLIRHNNTKLAKHKSYEYLTCWKRGKLLIVDSLGVYPAGIRSNWILLTQNAPIHLQRMIDSLRPTQIIADGSNWPALVERWNKTCLKNKIRFHYTGESGAYVVDLD